MDYSNNIVVAGFNDSEYQCVEYSVGDCPFCGSFSMHFLKDGKTGKYYRLAIRCMKCGCRGPSTIGKLNKAHHELAVTEWNKRS